MTLFAMLWMILTFLLCNNFASSCSSNVNNNEYYYNQQGNFNFSVLAHYMAWFQYPNNAYHWPPTSGMYYTPLVGSYSSLNESVIEWQLQLMKAAGINGVIVDWYGVEEKNDYPFIKNATEVLWEKIISHNMTLGICYDMNSSPDSSIIIKSMQYLNTKFFKQSNGDPHPNYLHDHDISNNNRPVLLIWPSLQVSSSLMNESFWLDISNNIINTSVIYSVEYLNPGWKGNTPGFGKFGWVYPQNSDFSNKTKQIEQVLDHVSSYYAFEMNGDDVNYDYGSVVVGSIIKGFSDHYVAGGTDTTNPYNSIGFINQDYGYINLTWNYTFDNIFLSGSKINADEVVMINNCENKNLENRKQLKSKKEKMTHDDEKIEKNESNCKDTDNKDHNYNVATESKSTYYILQIPTWNDYSEGTIIEPNVATSGCEYGCGTGNPYQDLLDIYQLIGNYSDREQNIPRNELQLIFEQITNNIFGNV